MKRILLLGAPGAGKGTQAQMIMNLFNIPQISTGDLLRAEVKSGSALGQELASILQSGQLVSDEIVTRLVKEKVAKPECKEGYLLDGFPRNLAQAHALEEANLDLDLVIEFDVPDEVIVERITGRRSHPASGRVYHVKFNPPKEEGKDDVTGEPLVTRPDDTEEVVAKRLEVYHTQTAPLVSYYRDLAKQGKVRFLKIDGNDEIEVVSKKLRDELRTVFN
ncbi:adenylate kinase [Psittacicella hinzii]|uniref:Adenylate kinase n=1 Tax=Psittacicella hinzii TaxID=2028575 RepID=A0A3A1YEB9_9GAMM|nr:adenylate kinase [Psittacicella hinzii]RIY34544.1 adenylate kinase [Psittacicella hinzii]